MRSLLIARRVVPDPRSRHYEDGVALRSRPARAEVEYLVEEPSAPRRQQTLAPFAAS